MAFDNFIPDFSQKNSHPNHQTPSTAYPGSHGLYTSSTNASLAVHSIGAQQSTPQFTTQHFSSYQLPFSNPSSECKSSTNVEDLQNWDTEGWQKTFQDMDWDLINSCAGLANELEGTQLSSGVAPPSSSPAPTNDAALTFINEFPPPPSPSPPSPPPSLQTVPSPLNAVPPSPSPPPPQYLPPAEPRRTRVEHPTANRTQGPREKRYRRELTAAEKAARAANLALNKQKRKDFHSEVAEALEAFQDKLREITGSHNKKPEEAFEVAWCASKLNRNRATSSHNALLHFVTKQENGGRIQGQRKDLDELNHIMANDPKYKNLKDDPGAMARLKQELDEDRAVKRVGVRTANLSISHDVQHVFDKCMEELILLHKHTGIRAFLYLTKGSEDCPSQPAWGTTDDDVQSFFRWQLGIEPWSLMSQFELWVYSQGKGTQRRTSQQWRQECVGMLTSLLQTTLKDFKQQMCYGDNYRRTLVHTRGVRLIGWPFMEDPEVQNDDIPVPAGLAPVPKIISPYSIHEHGRRQSPSSATLN
ncbi:hypothetical protein E1B28_010554 [Marasmius oreades]|uniref:Uncharacterized protein n=1 Tax=Marasmius oreades TaxID=181124 RepID=A0A9P7RY13_9AGAR|nr:uncharacterized protein E1B28_010554 [Marasmius oreades]KAG7091525.1 hypothetical protein E1B28_010554 [Marasmius oreades]